METAQREKMSAAIKRSKRIKIVRGSKMNESEAMALFMDASPRSGYIDQIRDIIKRNLSDNIKYFQIAILDLETNEPITDPLYGRQLAAQANTKLIQTGSPCRVRWIGIDANGNVINKLLAIPAEKYKPLRNDK